MVDFFYRYVAHVVTIILISSCPARVPEAPKIFVKSAFLSGGRDAHPTKSSWIFLFESP